MVMTPLEKVEDGMPGDYRIFRCGWRGFALKIKEIFGREAVKWGSWTLFRGFLVQKESSALIGTE
jgi:hypothetical protein